LHNNCKIADNKDSVNMLVRPSRAVMPGAISCGLSDTGRGNPFFWPLGELAFNAMDAAIQFDDQEVHL